MDDVLLSYELSLDTDTVRPLFLFKDSGGAGASAFTASAPGGGGGIGGNGVFAADFGVAELAAVAASMRSFSSSHDMRLKS